MSRGIFAGLIGQNRQSSFLDEGFDSNIFDIVLERIDNLKKFYRMPADHPGHVTERDIAALTLSGHMSGFYQKIFYGLQRPDRLNHHR